MANFEKMNVRKAAQLFSNSVTMAFIEYKKKPETAKLFKGIYCRNSISFVLLIMITVLDCIPTQNLAKLMNDVFDSLNGRHCKQGITLANMEDRLKPLKAMLKVLDITEQLH
jgi:hypothetical protein